MNLFRGTCSIYRVSTIQVGCDLFMSRWGKKRNNCTQNHTTHDEQQKRHRDIVKSCSRAFLALRKRGLYSTSCGACWIWRHAIWDNAIHMATFLRQHADKQRSPMPCLYSRSLVHSAQWDGADSGRGWRMIRIRLTLVRPRSTPLNQDKHFGNFGNADKLFFPLLIQITCVLP